jgi:hypothetical protein
MCITLHVVTYDSQQISLYNFLWLNIPFSGEGCTTQTFIFYSYDKSTFSVKLQVASVTTWSARQRFNWNCNVWHEGNKCELSHVKIVFIIATCFSETVFSSVRWLICVLAWRAGYEITLGEPTIDKLVWKTSEREIKVPFGM